MTAKKTASVSVLDREESAERKLNQAVATAKRLKAISREAKKRVKQAKKIAKEAAKSARKARKAAEEARREYHKMRKHAEKAHKKSARAKAPIATPKRRSSASGDHRWQFAQP
jgi:hypothetical protein